jgi:hypothetical protein
VQLLSGLGETSSPHRKEMGGGRNVRQMRDDVTAKKRRQRLRRLFFSDMSLIRD